jgi:RimJ/RimL family protein N-acetyltransferase
VSHPVPELRTARLLLRDWRESDLEPFAALNADPEVMRHFPSTLDRASSDLLVGRIRTAWQDHGFGLWALEVVGGPGFIGFVGLHQVPFAARFTPAVAPRPLPARSHHLVHRGPLRRC